MEQNTIQDLLSGNNSDKIKYVILFFVFFIALSQNVFSNLFGCKLKTYLNSTYVKHFICLLFLFLLVDMNFTTSNGEAYTSSNPLYSLFQSIIIYVFVFLLLHCNKIYILFIGFLICFLIILDKIKKYVEFNVKDQEVLQEQLNFIYKMNNVSVIIMALTIIIGTLTTLNTKDLMYTLKKQVKYC